jgi:DNA-binding response OmpR family regulator
LVATTAEILIVEDDEAIIGTLAYNLSRNGFGVKGATNGVDALQLARKLKPNLILLDIMRSVLSATPDSRSLLVWARTGSRRP